LIHLRHFRIDHLIQFSDLVVEVEDFLSLGLIHGYGPVALEIFYEVSDGLIFAGCLKMKVDRGCGAW